MHRDVAVWKPWKVWTVVMAALLAAGVAPRSFGAESPGHMMCGPHALWLASASLGGDATLARISQLAETNPVEGTNALNLMRAARSLGLHAAVVKTGLAGLRRHGVRAIVLLDKDTHFAYVKRIDAGGVVLVEDLKEKRLSARGLNARWNGMAILIARAPEALVASNDYARAALPLCIAGAALLLAGAAHFVLLRLPRRSFSEVGHIPPAAP